jgi:endonuclease YncB( thermonuclease family)
MDRFTGGAAEAWLEVEPTNRDKTHRGALVRYVWVWGKLLNFELVRAGWAKVDEDGRKGKYGPLLIAAEEEAKRLRSGLWR